MLTQWEKRDEKKLQIGREVLQTMQEIQHYTQKTRKNTYLYIEVSLVGSILNCE